MVQKKWMLDTRFFLFSIFIIPFYCTLPEDPHSPPNAKMSIILKGSDGTQSTTFIIDSTGKTIEIGMASFLPEFIDSFNLKIVSPGNPDTLDTIFFSTNNNTTDTLWISYVFSTPGTKTVIVTPYSQYNPAPVEANITVYERVLPVNNKPSITISGNRNIVQGTTCFLTVETTDSDNGQSLTLSFSDNPGGSYLISDSLFVWEPPETFSGDTTVLFIVTDNGIPLLSDTEKVTITVSERTGNGAPQWSVNALPVSMHITSLCTLVLGNICEDPDGDELTFTLVEGDPSGDEIKDGIYRFTAPEGSAGSYNVKIVATDPDGVNDTLAIELTVDTSEAGDTIPAVMYILGISAEHGSVTRSPDQAEYDSGTVVTLTPVPAEGYHFTGWSGALSGSDNPAEITMDGVKSVTAEFVANQPNSYTLTVLATYGTVEKTPDQMQYESGTEVGLKAIPNTGYIFINWSGDADGTSDETMVTMDEDKNVSAIFKLLTYTLTLNAGTGGTISEPSSPATVNHGAAITIIASPNSGYRFNGWTVTSGTAMIDDDSLVSTSVSLFSGNASVTANFKLKRYQVTFDTYGGTLVEPDTVNHGSLLTEPASIRPGLTLVGWYTEEEYQNLWDFSSNVVTSPITLHAKWQVRDKDGNVYDTIRIGNQTWMLQNFRCSVYDDGTPIQHVADSAQWVGLSTGEIGAYCFYNNSTNTTFTQKFGALYNWYAVNNTDFAPTGWRVPTAADWEELKSYVEVNYSSRAGKELASTTDWTYGPNEGSVGNDQESNNATGFTAYPGGARWDGAFNQMGNTGFWWTADADPVDTDIAVNYYIAYYFSVLYSNTTDKSIGYSVRLVKTGSQ